MICIRLPCKQVIELIQGQFWILSTITINGVIVISVLFFQTGCLSFFIFADQSSIVIGKRKKLTADLEYFTN